MAKDASAPPTTHAARLEQIEHRLRSLEAVVFAPGGEAPPGSALDDDERFWALGGLKERAAGRSVVLFTGHVHLEGTPVYEWQQGAEVDALLADEVDRAASALAALGHPVRLRLLQAVVQGRTAATELGSMEGLGTSGQLYHHLRELQAAGWLRSASRGRYAVPPARVVPLLTILAAAQP